MTQLPYAWSVEVTGVKPEIFFDFGRALVMAIQRGGKIVTLYAGPHHPKFTPEPHSGVQ